MEQLKKRLEALNGSEKCWAAAVFCLTFAAFTPALSGTELVSDDLFYFFNAVSVKNAFKNIAIFLESLIVGTKMKTCFCLLIKL